jgi:hypothetical protein
MTRGHVISDTLQDRVAVVVENLKKLLEKAKTVILMQYDLTEDDRNFFLSFTGADLYDESLVFKRKVRHATQQHCCD